MDGNYSPGLDPPTVPEVADTAIGWQHGDREAVQLADIPAPQ